MPTRILGSGMDKWFLPQEQGFKMKISSIDFHTQIDILARVTNNVWNMVTSHNNTKLVQSCINPNVQMFTSTYKIDLWLGLDLNPMTMSL